MVDIIAYVRGGENEELRYAIRSWCENLVFDKLCIVGGPKPTWLKPDIYIEKVDGYETMKQAYENVKAGMEEDRLSENVLLLMDDVFVLERVGEWPEKCNFNRGPLQAQYQGSVDSQGVTAYNHLLKNTLEKLQTQYGIEEPLSFEEHTPFWCNRKEMLKVLEECEPSPHSILYRSIYGNTRNDFTVYKPDSKARNDTDTIPKNAPFTSSNDTSFRRGQVGIAIREWFPNPSKFEA